MTLFIAIIAMIATWVGAYWTYQAANTVHIISKNIEVNEQTRQIIPPSTRYNSIQTVPFFLCFAVTI
jgi:hypothetical protein